VYFGRAFFSEVSEAMANQSSENSITYDTIMDKFVRLHQSYNYLSHTIKGLLFIYINKPRNNVPLDLLDTIVSCPNSKCVFDLILHLSDLEDIGLDREPSPQAVSSLVNTILRDNITGFNLRMTPMSTHDNFIKWFLQLVDFVHTKLADQPFELKTTLGKLWKELIPIGAIYNTVCDCITLNDNVTSFAFLFIFELICDKDFDRLYDYGVKFRLAFIDELENPLTINEIIYKIHQLSCAYEAISSDSIARLELLKNIDSFARH
jgi:hypothetical protein